MFYSISYYSVRIKNCVCLFVWMTLVVYVAKQKCYQLNSIQFNSKLDRIVLTQKVQNLQLSIRRYWLIAIPSSSSNSIIKFDFLLRSNEKKEFEPNKKWTKEKLFFFFFVYLFGNYFNHCLISKKKLNCNQKVYSNVCSWIWFGSAQKN